MQFKIITVPKYNRDIKMLLYLNCCINNINYDICIISILFIFKLNLFKILKF